MSVWYCPEPIAFGAKLERRKDAVEEGDVPSFTGLVRRPTPPVCP